MTTDAEPPTPLGRILIAGGTLTAWIAAVRLASALRGTVRVTVVAPAGPVRPTSPQVTALSPAFRDALFDRLGTPESTWMRACSASFNAATKFAGWRPDPVYLPDAATPPDCEGFPLTDFWQLRRRTGRTTEPVDHACFVVPPLLDAGKSPRWLDGRAAFPYGWHADSGLLAEFLRRTAVDTCGVRVRTAEILGADRDDAGLITALHTTGGREEADLFLDCTGPAARLMSGLLGEPFVPAAGHAPADRTATVTVPHDTARLGIEPYTTVTALPEGMLWRRPLPGRCDAALAYASTRTTPDEVAGVLLRAVGLPGTDAARRTVTHTAFTPGRLRRSWAGNCLALGAAAGSADPLAEDHATTLDLLDRLLRDLPSRTAPEAPAARFDAAAAAHHDRALDLARLRHATSPAGQTDPAALPARLRSVLRAHAAGLAPAPGELPLRTLLTVLTPHTAAPPAALAHHPHAVRAAEDAFTRIRRHQRTLLETLPPAHSYLAHLTAPAAAPGRAHAPA
ncbi:tryptophan 7-halogenase [Kitasatospora sp. NPDC047058]|uniref:tryptophan 7-halogenase n=1 Tax=Kitasatospora sp. NPDC047058 TaxID=3155620 RepID=UPI0033F2B6F5